MEAGSVAIQMGVFKASGRKKRLFRMSPIHHHFELVGWPETTVIIRFWLISAICVAIALGIFIGDFTEHRGGCDRDARTRVRPRSRRGRHGAGTATPRTSRSSSPTTTSPTSVARLAARARRADSSSGRSVANSTGWSRSCDLVSPAPGVPETHAVIAAAQTAGVELVSEIELAYRWEQQRTGGPRPMLAITGTDGKTTTTLLAVEMLRAGGLRTIDAGNTDTPLVDAIDAGSRRVRRRVHELPPGVDADVPGRRRGLVEPRARPPELASRRCRPTRRPRRRCSPTSGRPTSPIGFVDRPVVMRNLAAAPGRHVTFGLDAGRLPQRRRRRISVSSRAGTATSSPIEAMRRSLPHDITNTLAASALVLETGLGRRSAVAHGLATFTGPPHRLEHVANMGRRRVVQRLEGDHAARRRRSDPLVRSNHAHRRRIRQGRRPVADGGRSASHVDAVIALGATAPALAARVRRRWPGVDRGLPDMAAAVELARTIAAPGTPCCCRRGVPASISTRNFEAPWRTLPIARHASTERDRASRPPERSRKDVRA